MSQIIHALGHVKLNVKDLDREVKDLTEILGLRVTRKDSNCVWLSSNGRAAELILISSEENSCHTIGLEALTREAVQNSKSRVHEVGCEIISDTPSLDCFSDAITFKTPEGLRFEIHTPAKDQINEQRFNTIGVKPRRIDHVNFLTPNPAATLQQLNHIGDIKVSEKMINDGLTWLYGGNRQHHILGMVKSHAPGIHHTSFEFPEFNMYCALGDILDRHDRQLIWGPGRHRPGDNTYAYFLASSGAMIECSGPMSQIANDEDFTPNIITNLERPGNVRSMNVWGTPAPKEWLEHFHPFENLK
jgi:catechol 2,3-dioxygenase